MQATNVENIVLDQANHRTYVILAPRVLSDGELYRAIRQELLKRGGKPLAHGETLTLTLTSSGRTIASALQPEAQASPSSSAVPSPAAEEPLSARPAPLA